MGAGELPRLDLPAAASTGGQFWDDDGLDTMLTPAVLITDKRT